MSEIIFYNTLTRTKEKFVPISDLASGARPQGKMRDPGPFVVKMYTCGPTVYDYAQIGNWRTYTLSDLIVRTLEYNGYLVDYVMNLTDVGHLTGDNLGDADVGEDRLEKTAKKERKTAWEIADFYAKDFVQSTASLNLTPPKLFAKATEHILEQIDLVKKLEEKGFAYRIADGIYFDVAAYEAAGNRYGELSNLDEIDKGSRVEINPEKRSRKDFALWKFSPKSKMRDMEWKSPWGLGFPGWHIECSAMSMKYLGSQFDIHAGGEDLRPTHHPNEIAQSEAATGKKPFVKYWIHGAFLLVDGGRMGKSQGNAHTLMDIRKRGFSPLALRYFYLTGHYRKQINFTWDSLAAAQKALDHLSRLVGEWGEAKIGCAEYEEKFLAAINDDLDLPKALALVWDLIKSDYPDSAKKASLLKFDKILGLGLGQVHEAKMEVSPSANLLLSQREEARQKGDFTRADEIRREIETQGYSIEDRPEGPILKKK